MWKNGQCVTINGRRYRVTKADGNKLKACYMCCAANRPIPCAGRFNYESGKEFWRGECLKKVPDGSYLKPIVKKKGIRICKDCL